MPVQQEIFNMDFESKSWDLIMNKLNDIERRISSLENKVDTSIANQSRQELKCKDNFAPKEVVKDVELLKQAYWKGIGAISVLMIILNVGLKFWK